MDNRNWFKVTDRAFTHFHNMSGTFYFVEVILPCKKCHSKECVIYTDSIGEVSTICASLVTFYSNEQRLLE